jgi:hypothetical protein
MSPALRLLVGILGGVLSVSLIAVISVLGVARQLPADLTALSSWESPHQSTVVDNRQRVRAELRIVEPGIWPGDEHEELVEAFFAAAPTSFYESRSRRATSLGPALRRALRGEGPPASSMSIELARLLLAAEEPGPVRRVRVDLVATWLDAEVSVSRRAVAWLDRAPLCVGRRGLRRAADTCFGRPLGQLDLADLTALAVAATWRLDLAGDRDQVRARRTQVLDELATRGRLSAVEAASLAHSPIPAPRSRGAEDWVDLISLGVRRRLGRGQETRPARIETSLHWPLQQELAGRLGATAAWLALQPDSGAVVAVNGDILSRLSAGSPSVGHVVAWAAGVVGEASDSGRLPGRPVSAISPMWFRQVVLGADARRHREIVPWEAAMDPLEGFAHHPLLRLPPQELLGLESLADLPLVGAYRNVRVAGVRLRLHGDLVVGWAETGADVVLDGLEDYVSDVAFSRPGRYAWSNDLATDGAPGAEAPQ